jgi:nitrous oxidase accessory protein NosD
MRCTVDSVRIVIVALALVILPALVSSTRAAVLTVDTVWSGSISLEEDILIPAGVTLTIAPGTIVSIAEAESTKTDPEYLSPLVEITVRGTLRAAGIAQAPIIFSSPGRRQAGAWAGLLIDGGDVILDNCRIGDADTAVHLLRGTLTLHATVLAGNRYGLVLQEAQSVVHGTANQLTANDYGLVVVAGPPTDVAFASITGNLKRDVLTLPRREPRLPDDPGLTALPPPPVSRRYGDKVLEGETVWRGRVEVNGIVRVPEGSRLVILPGTLIEFGFKDSNADGIGENGLLIQGLIIAKGTPAAPIVFRAREDDGRRVSWDAINIMNSDAAWNLIEHCRIENAYRGLHFHFSRVSISDSELTGNYRGIQFQESTVVIRDNRLFANSSAVQCRDSQVTFTGNTIRGNWQGVNFLRVNLAAHGNRIVANAREGVRIREGATVFEDNLVDGNRYGLLVMDAYFGIFARNSISNNGETGFSLKNADNLQIVGNFVAGNGLNGMSVQEAGGRISANLFSDNGEHGVGIRSFAGVLEENNFTANGSCAIDLDGSNSVAAPRNWWGGDSPDQVICDQADDPAKGRVASTDPANSPYRFVWPLAVVAADLTWRGELEVPHEVTVLPGATLAVAPGTRVVFAAGAGLTVKGKLLANGEAAARIVFTARDQQVAGAWGELVFERANGSIVAHCVVEYATWGLHSHFTQLAVSDSIIRNNYGGIRFRSGPLTVERSVITHNTIGIRNYVGKAKVTGSVITANDIGVFVREKGGGLILSGNNIYANRNLNLRIGDFNDEDVAASGNWWGEADPLTTIYDGRQEPGIGIVRIDPVLTAPLALSLPRDIAP